MGTNSEGTLPEEAVILEWAEGEPTMDARRW